MGKNTKVMPQYPAIYLFSWEREGILTSQTLHDLDKVSMTHLKIVQNMYIFPVNFAPFQ